MIFASTPQINDDPTPWVLCRHDREVAPRSNAPDFDDYHEWHDRENSADYRPRPEFNRPRAHEENPILVGIRALYPDGLTHWLAKDAAKYLTGGTHALGVPTTPEHRDHARRVLSRLARMKEATNA